MSENQLRSIAASKLHPLDFDEDIEYTIVGSAESDIKNNKISDESPIGKALVGAKAKQTVTAVTPAGDEIKLKVLKVSR